MPRPGSPRPGRESYGCPVRSPSRRRSAYDPHYGRSSAVRLIVAGAGGFIGSHFSERLTADGHHVLGIDNFISGSEDNLSGLAHEPRFELLRADVCDPLDVRGIDGVLHLASPASPVDYLIHPIETLKAGSYATHNLLEVARKNRARFMLASTSEVYGDPAVHPQPETYWGNVNPIGPRGAYDEANRYAEAMVIAYHRQQGVDTCIARIFNTYGPRMRPNDGRAVPTFMRQALAGKPLTVFGDGSQTRSFCYVDDLMEGLYRLAFSGEHTPVNIGNPTEMTLTQLAEEIISVTGSASEIVYSALPIDDPKVRRPDIAKARRLLEWEPRI